MIKTEELSKYNVLSIIGAATNDYDGQKSIVPVWKRGMSNQTASYGEHMLHMFMRNRIMNKSS